MFGLSGGHLLILAVVVLLFGRNRLPELGSAMGKGINAFRKGLAGVDANNSDKQITKNETDSKQNPDS